MSESTLKANLLDEIAVLRVALLHKEQELERLNEEHSDIAETNTVVNGLTNNDIERYSRQLILPEFGVPAQLKLKQSSFLIVGMGGLGCPAAQYLLAAGCGRIGLVDYDIVERSNFHRQILHTEERINMPKVESARLALRDINPYCQVDTHRYLLDSENALAVVSQYDVVLDCSDNVPTRYLLNDACVILHKPLVSGSALQLDGQLAVYNLGEECPCYRCLYPVPPPPETVTKCGDGGVLGAVTGVIGSLQALEAIKIAVGLGNVLVGRMLIFDGSRCIFRNIKLRSRRIDCAVCSAEPMITRLINYEQFCGMYATDKDHDLTILPSEHRIPVEEYKELRSDPHLLIDVRSRAEFEICQLAGAVNVPLKEVLNDNYAERFTTELADDQFPIIVLCRRGNDSQVAVQHMRNKFPRHSIRDVVGGLHAWRANVDYNFPYY